MGKEDLKNKPEQIREKIVDGRINKRLNELSLTEQEYIRDNNKNVGEIVKETVAQLGENIQIRRFTRYWALWKCKLEGNAYMHTNIHIESARERIACVGLRCLNPPFRGKNRFNLGEGIEKRVDNFAEEVAAQTQKQAEKAAQDKEDKPAAAAPPPEAESKKAEAPPPAGSTVSVKAGDVKLLREKTGKEESVACLCRIQAKTQLD